ncbi:MAG: GtrA family protein [Marmoricola sp.]|nr:GtrA family protein [Marmoricola sp.]
MPLPLLRPTTGREVSSFLLVGGLGYVVDVVAFNVLLSVPPVSRWDPSIARTLAMVLAMVVTYSGNRRWTWRGPQRHARRREVGLFVLFNVIGLAISVAILVLTHDVMGLTSRLADNISANVIGLGLATLFRFWAYRTFVFGEAPTEAQAPMPEPLEEHGDLASVG